MGLKQDAHGDTFVDVLERILDKGVVIDTWARISALGLELVTAEAHIVVASIETYLEHSGTLGASVRASTPARRVRADSHSLHLGHAAS